MNGQILMQTICFQCTLTLKRVAVNEDKDMYFVSFVNVLNVADNEYHTFSNISYAISQYNELKTTHCL